MAKPLIKVRVWEKTTLLAQVLIVALLLQGLGI